MKIIKSEIISRYINARKLHAILFTISYKRSDAKKLILELHKLSNLTAKKFSFGSRPKLDIHTKVIAEFSQLIYNIYSEHDYLVTELPSIFPIHRLPSERRFQLFLYSSSPKGFLILAHYICQILEGNSKDIQVEFRRTQESLIKRVEQANKLNRLNKNFLNSAYKLKIPILKIAAEIFQFGWGKHSFQLGGTFTEKTPRNSVVMVRNKYATNQILKRAGFPVLDEDLVKEEKSCKKFIDKYGFPVVIKPADKDAGAGIQADITNQKELSKAFKNCLKISKNILIQRVATGNHYRLTVVNGKLVWTFKQLLAAVVGDGQSKISLLIKKENSCPKRNSIYKSIPINEATNILLKKQNLDMDSIPAKGEKVKLGTISNVYAGAIPFVIPKDKVHPDNIFLIERAANLFRLDVTGIDFFIEDISKSWLEQEAKILEINSCPDLSPSSPHLYDIILSQAISGDGRVPTVLILSDSNNETDLRKFVSFCSLNGKKAGIFSHQKIRINNQLILSGSSKDLSKIDILLMDNSIDFLIMVVESTYESFKLGLPIDRFDSLCIESHLPREDGKKLGWLNKCIEFDISKNKKINNEINFGLKKIVKNYSNVNDYLIENIPYFENYHRKKFHPIEEPKN
ncbi:MAG: hypothetical protein ACJ0DD_10455 [Paracoccaceae bacterium]